MYLALSDQHRDVAGQAVRAHPRWSPVPFPGRRTIEIDPDDMVRRRSATWSGMSAESLQATELNRFSMRFRAPVHLLMAYHEGLRHEGETTVSGMLPTRSRDFRRKLSFVPAGSEFREWQAPRALAQITCIYLDPGDLPHFSEAMPELKPRLLFEDFVLWETTAKLRTLLESSDADNGHYLEAVGSVLRHELVRLLAGKPAPDRTARGGLAAWQQRVVLEYIDEHLADTIPLSVLAGLTRLSPHHFCRAFKSSLGRPPLRYQGLRRIERAKLLLGKVSSTITEIGLSVGFSETSSFTAAFRRETGLTPSDFRRSLA
jgi:AraC family transcriptional regulator